MNELVAKQLVGGQPAVEERLNWWREQFRFRAAQAVGRLRTGEMTLPEFSEWGYDELKDTLYGIAETGAGRRLSRKEIYQVRRVLKEQDTYWSNFAQSIGNERKILAAKGLKGAEFDEAFDKLHDKWGRRAQSYSGAITAEGTKWAMAAQFPDGSWWKWTKTPVESCETCIERDGKIYQMKDGRLPFYPKNGSTICLYNCKCFWDPIAKPSSGRRRKLGPTGARRRGKKLRQKSEEDVFDWGSAILCGICGRVLTDPSSVAKGIGPVCEKHMGPGPHPSGSPQSAHAGKRGKGAKLPKGGRKGGFGDPDAIIKEELIGSSNAQPTIVEFADGSRGIHKFDENVTYGDPRGEVLTYDISEALGWDIVPETINWEREFEGEVEPGTLQEFVEDSFTWAETFDKSPSQLFLESPSMTLLDAMIGNRDRHGGNILEDHSGNIWAIDNNGAFGFVWGYQDYRSVADFTKHLAEELDWIREVGDPERFAWAAQRYDGLFADIAKFAKSRKQQEIHDEIFAQIDSATAKQFTNNVNALAEFGESKEWRAAMGIWEERAETEGFEWG